MKHRIFTIAVSMIVLSVSGAFGQVTIQTTDIKCNGLQTGKATLTISNAPGPYKTKWLKGAAELPQYKDKLIASGLSEGDYTVEITDKNDCMVEKSFTIEEPDALSISISSSTGSFDYCGAKSFPDVTLYGTSDGGTPPRSCSVNSCLKKVTGPGEYSFTVTDANGCKETESVRVNWVGIVCSIDPNDITGPTGYSTPKWVKADEPLEYTIRFENDDVFATAPAQHVLIEYIFDPKINPFSLRLGNFGFGDFLYTLPFTSTYYQERIDLQNELGLYVDVVAGIDINANRAFWSFQSIDPVTGLPPIDPQIGFLPVNDTLTGEGEGFVTFMVTPKSNVLTGDTVSAAAAIVFDINEEINTNTWTNKLDAAPPSSTLNPLDSLVESPTIELSWTGQDDAGGCGVREYALFYQVNGGPFILHVEGITGTSLIFEGDPGNEYGFYIVATDQVGNVEQKTTAEQTTTIYARDLIEILAPYSDPICTGDSILIAWRTTNIDSLNISMSIDSGQTFDVIAPLKLPGDTLMVIYTDDSLITNFAQFMLTTLEDTMYSVRSAFFPIKPLPEIVISGDASICEGEVANLIASGGNFYNWSPGQTLNDSTSANPTAYIDSIASYYLIGTDVFGCTNVDSVTILKHPVYLDSLVHAMCNEDSVFVGGGYQTEPGFYTDSLAASTGCDSTVVTEVILTGPCAFPADQVYVDKDATGLNNGTSWANAFVDLQDALEAVEYYVDVTSIWVAEGDYFPSVPTGRDARFTLRDSVKIYGGFVGTEILLEDRTGNETIVKLSGDLGVPNDSLDNAYHVIHIDSTCADCIINSLTIKFGQGDGINEQTYGAGLYVEGIVTLDGVTVERNTTLLEGAAIFNSGAGTLLTIRDCLFRLNTSSLARDILNTNGAEIRFEGMNTVED